MFRQKGLSLVELMIAIALGLVLIAGVLQIFLSAKVVYSTHDAIARAQESGRLANEFLSHDIRMAGYSGCATSNAINLTNTLNNSTDFWFRFNTAVEGLDVANEGGAATLPTGISLSPAPVSGTDVLILRGAFDNGLPVVQNNNGAQVFAEKTSTDTGACAGSSDGFSGLCAGDILVIADCSKARIFQATNVVAAGAVVNIAHSASGAVSPGNAVASWGGSSVLVNEKFGTDAEILRMATVVYYIALNPATGRRALWKRIDGNASGELLEGIADMQVLYGRDTDGDKVPDQFQTATAISAANGWSNVLGIRVHLLTQSNDDNMVPDPQPYTFYGATQTPSDRRLRQVFVSTIGLRSRLK